MAPSALALLWASLRFSARRIVLRGSTALLTPAVSLIAMALILCQSATQPGWTDSLRHAAIGGAPFGVFSLNVRHSVGCLCFPVTRWAALNALWLGNTVFPRRRWLLVNRVFSGARLSGPPTHAPGGGQVNSDGGLQHYNLVNETRTRQIRERSCPQSEGMAL